jgi:glyoxylase-like metal-dependent hydrolase (beta-lactamase superfamily II)
MSEAINGTERVAPGVFRLRTLIANVFLVSATDRESGPWVLVDAGIRGYADTILNAGAAIFGRELPSAVLLTHGHFDHVGSLPALLERSAVPVYSHMLEFPFLTGRSAYPPPDPTVGGGLMARASVLFPNAPIDLGPRLLALPEDGSVPGLEGWQWHHTPGHSPGHVSFYRKADRVLLSGDAVITVRQESLVSVALQRMEVRPPPAYFTIDWPESIRSIRRIAGLRPAVLATGHGRPMRGERMLEQLQRLAEWPERAIPARGRYVARPARPGGAVAAFRPAYVTPRRSRVPMMVAAAAALVGAVALRRRSAR